MAIWAEVHDLPHVTDPGKKIAWLPMLDYRFGRHADAFREEGSVSLPTAYSRMREIHHVDPDTHANDVGSVVHFFQRGVLGTDGRPKVVGSFVPERKPDDLQSQATGTTQLSGKGLTAYFLDRLLLWPFDYPVNPSADPDWLWGDANIIRNGGFEDHPYGVPNRGFEDGTREPWWPGAVEGFSANGAIVTTPVDEGTYAFAVTPLRPEGGASTSVQLVPANFYTVTARVQGVAGVTYQIGAQGPEDMSAVFGNSELIEFSGSFAGQFEVQHEFVGTGAYQTVTLIFGTSGSQRSAQLNIREGEAVLNGGTFFIDVVEVTGFGIGTAPWEPTGYNAPNVPGPVTKFEVGQTHVTEGLWALNLGADPGHGASYQLTGIVPGATYTMSVDIGWSNAASQWALQAVDAQGSVIRQVTASIPTNDFEPLEITFKVPYFLPGPRGDLFLRVINADTVNREVWVDNLQFYRGQPPTTIGDILEQLLAHAVARGDLVWLVPTFDAVNDSNGVPWDKVRSVFLSEGSSLGQIVESMQRLWKYIVRIRYDRETNTYYWDAFNPGYVAVDHSTTTTGMLMVGQSIGGGELVTRTPEAVRFKVTTDDGVWAEATDTDLTTPWGEGDFFTKIPTGTPTDVTDALSEAQARNQDQMVTFQADMNPLAQVEPLRDIDVLHKVGVELGEKSAIPRGDRIVTSVVVSGKPGRKPDYQVFVNSDAFASSGAAGLAEAVRRLLRRPVLSFRREEPAEPSLPQPVGGGGGGMMTVTVASSEASSRSISKADFVCSGTDDHLVIREALALLDPGGTLWLSEGIFYCTWPSGGANVLHGTQPGITIRGMGPRATFIRVAGTPSASDQSVITLAGDGAQVLDLDIEDWQAGTTPTVAIVVGGSYAHVARIHSYTHGRGVWVSSSGIGAVIDSCWIEMTTAGTAVDINPNHSGAVVSNSYLDAGYGVEALGHETKVIGNTIHAALVGVVIGSGDYQRVIGNTIWDCDQFMIEDIGGRGPYIAGNYLNGFLGSPASGEWAIKVISQDAVVTGNVLENCTGGILIDSSSPGGVVTDNILDVTDVQPGIRSETDGLLIRGNRIASVGHGIHINVASDNVIEGNLIDASAPGAHNTYDGIFVQGDANRNLIKNNRIIGNTGATQPRYGINISDATSDDNIYVGNYAEPADFGTGSYNDAGTGTEIVHPNAASPQGDNFGGAAGTPGGGGGAESLDDLDDVSAASPNDDDILRYDTGTGLWQTEALPPAGAFDLGDADDASFGTPVEGDMVYRNDVGLWVVVGGTKADGLVPTIQADGSVVWEAPGGGATSPLTTKGDVWGYGTGDARIPVGANGQVLTADSAETLGVKWAAAPGGGGSGELLAHIIYDPGTLADYISTSATFAALDTTNLRITFTAPASGKVVIRFHAVCRVTNNDTRQLWGIMESGILLTGSERAMAAAIANIQRQGSYVHVVTGLTGGNSYTYDWAHARQTGSGNASTLVGGVVEAAVMEVWAG